MHYLDQLARQVAAEARVRWSIDGQHFEQRTPDAVAFVRDGGNRAVIARLDQGLEAVAGMVVAVLVDEAHCVLAPPQAAGQSPAPHFVELVKREAAGIDALGGSPESRGKQLFTGGYTIETTLDPAAREQVYADAWQWMQEALV